MESTLDAANAAFFAALLLVKVPIASLLDQPFTCRSTGSARFGTLVVTTTLTLLLLEEDEDDEGVTITLEELLEEDDEGVTVTLEELLEEDDEEGVTVTLEELLDTLLALPVQLLTKVQEPSLPGILCVHQFAR